MAVVGPVEWCRATVNRVTAAGRGPVGNLADGQDVKVTVGMLGAGNGRELQMQVYAPGITDDFSLSPDEAAKKLGLVLEGGMAGGDQVPNFTTRGGIENHDVVARWLNLLDVGKIATAAHAFKETDPAEIRVADGPLRSFTVSWDGTDTSSPVATGPTSAEKPSR